MADWSLPGLTTLYTLVLSILKDRDFDAASLFYNGSPTNPQTGMMKYLRAGDKFQEYDGATWNDKLLSIAGGGTGAATAAGARTNLGLGTIAVQNANNVTITGGTITGVPLDATALVGLVPTSSLGSGAANSGTWLRGDQTWQAIPAGTPTGVISMYGGTAAPATWLMCDGAAVSRITYAALFTAIGTAFGAGDLSTTFNLPDLRQRFPLGKAASGTGSTLGSTGGSIDHTHTSAAHTHTVAGHTHTGPSHTHTIASAGAHTHIVDADTDDQGSHTHTGTTDTPGGGNFSVAGGFDSLCTTTSHTHTFTTGSSGTHHHRFGTTSTSDGAHDHGGNTGSSGTGSTSSTSLTTDSTTPGATGSNNPPYQVVNYIIKT